MLDSEQSKALIKEVQEYEKLEKKDNNSYGDSNTIKSLDDFTD